MSFCKFQYLLGWKAHQTEQQSLKVHFGGLELNITRTCTLGNEMQLQLCAQDEGNTASKANLGHTSSGLPATDETATRFARFGKSCT